MKGLSFRSRFAENPNDDGNVLAAKLMKEGKEVIKLNRGDPVPYFKTPDYILEAYEKALREGRTGYSTPAGIVELREAIAKRYKRTYGLNTDANHILITAGVSEAVRILNEAIIDEGDKAVIFRPYYPLYMNSFRLEGGKAILQRYKEERNWDVDPEELREELKKRENRDAKYIIIANPSNPTGTVLPRKTLEEIVDVANEYKMLLVSDEIYDELVYNGAKFTSIAELAKGLPYMILNGASKDYDATGFRLGFAIIPNDDEFSTQLRKKMIDFLNMRLSVNTPAQYAFLAALNNDKEHRRALGSMLRGIESRVNLATHMINEMDYMHAVTPNAAFYIFPKLNMDGLKIRNDKEFQDKLLQEEFVQLTRGSGFGEPDHIRIVSLATEDILSKAIEKIEKFCKRHAK